VRLTTRRLAPRAFATLAIVTVATVASAAPRKVPLGTIRAQVRRTKRELETNTEQRDYRASPYHPSEIVERIHAMESGAAWDELCTELGQLPDDELELFEDELRKPEHARRMACSAALFRRIDAYWKTAARELGEAHPLTGAGKLESVVVPVDVSQPHTFTGADFPEGQIAITFDDGPHATRTPRVLEILKAAGVRATFFEIGRNASAHPEISRQVRAAGHSVGSHTFSHADLPKVTEAHAEAEVESGEASVALALGVTPRDLPFFRFPYGAKTLPEQAFVSRRGNSTFFWNMDSEDWRVRDPHRLFVNVLQQIDHEHAHGVILFHDIHEQTVIVLPHVLAELAARHVKTVVFVPIGRRPELETN
jgi:peptidoglycan/xylan/chitin deacetylase (PgdA/CDA1 family)